MREPETKRDTILNAAIKAFARKGYYSCRTRDISIEAGIGYGLLYHYFNSKDEILLNIFKERWDLFLRRIDKAKKTISDPLEQLMTILDFVLESYRKNPDVMRVLVIDVPLLKQFYTQENLALYFNRFLIELTDIIIIGQKKGLFRKEVSPQFASIMIQGTIDMTIRQYVYNQNFPKEFDVAETKERFREILKGALLAR